MLVYSRAARAELINTFLEFEMQIWFVVYQMWWNDSIVSVT